ncbi:hypothetical protein NS277_07195 [Novosphingobium barchaimii]|nr:hypothetical protein NS277_07195 [Novosphingobium barchaimii]
MPRSDRTAWKRAKWWLYWLHRWTGIALCVLFAVWFVSGVVMMYVPFPSFRAEERVAGAAPIDWRQVKIGPAAALAAVGSKHFPDEFRLEMAGGEPVYRISSKDTRQSVSARSGKAFGPFDAAHAGRVAASFGRAGVSSVDLVDRDQWVVTRAYARLAPFWRVRLDDGRATDIYVSRSTGEIVQNTDRPERLWNWLGAVPHWIYFTALRTHQEPWRQTVLWASGIGLVGAALGIWIGILRVRVRRRYKSGSISPYRGWMKWHHLAGLVGGAFLVTWVFSGWLSMSPFGGFGTGDAEAIKARYIGKQEPRFTDPDLVKLAQAADNAVELRFVYIAGRPLIMAVSNSGQITSLAGSTALPTRPDLRTMQAIAVKAVPAGRMTASEILTSYDRYWYSTGNPRTDQRPLPVLRLKFDDPEQSWLYIDPKTGQLVGQSSKGRRTYRWLFSALHSFDFPALLAVRPLRDALMIILSIAGLIVSVSGIIVGWRYVARDRRRPSPETKSMQDKLARLLSRPAFD